MRGLQLYKLSHIADMSVARSVAGVVLVWTLVSGLLAGAALSFVWVSLL